MWGVLLGFRGWEGGICSCVPTVLLVEIQLGSLVCMIHKNSLLLKQHNGNDAPQNYNCGSFFYYLQTAVTP